MFFHVIIPACVQQVCCAGLGGKGQGIGIVGRVLRVYEYRVDDVVFHPQPPFAVEIVSCCGYDLEVVSGEYYCCSRLYVLFTSVSKIGLCLEQEFGTALPEYDRIVCNVTETLVCCIAPVVVYKIHCMAMAFVQYESSLFFEHYAVSR